MNTQNYPHKKTNTACHSQHGVILLINLFIMLMVAVVGMSMLSAIATEVQMADNQLLAAKTFYYSQAAVEKAICDLRLNPKVTLASLTAPSFSGYTTTLSVTNNGSAYDETVSSGPYAGLDTSVQPITITANVTHDATGISSQITQEVLVQAVSVFQMGVFYENDLEILPGSTMNFIGPVHTNGNLYVGTHATLKINSLISAVGSIFHGRKNDPSATMSGAVQFQDGDGVYQDMYENGYWLDSTQANWETESVERWDGLIQDSAHGVTRLTLPIPSGIDYHDIIERSGAGDASELADIKYHNKAGLVIIDGVATDGSGGSVTLPSGAVTTSSFYDQREGKTMDITNIDVSVLISGGVAPTNGVIYVSNTNSNPSDPDKAVRLINGTELPPQGLTVASDNPVYIQGNYNTINKVPASVAGDAVTLLSSAWNDVNSQTSSQGLSSRVANSTTYNTAIMTGNTESDSTTGEYSGGLENLPRFLESWSGKTMTYKGAMVDLWYAESATGSWSYGGKVYTAPTRNWEYDFDFRTSGGLPPGTPLIYTVQRSTWKEE